MDDDFDSGDDLFDNVDADELVTQNKRPASQGDAANGSDGKRQRLDLIGVGQKLLQEKFGYDKFRHEQEGAIGSVLRGENTLVVFPTGAGKSLCYQIPAIAFDEVDKLNGENRDFAGITIVVSPLIALMKDQTDALKRKGIAAECNDSTKSFEQLQQISADIRSGRLRMLYCSPEKLNNEGFVESLKYVPGGIRLLAVDEAHCISEWGHSFRPDYLKVARFVDEIKAERVVCLTATATPKVADDICKQFKIDQSNVYRTSPYRPNLHLQAMSTPTEKVKTAELLKYLDTHKGSTLVYVTVQRQAEELAATLKAKGHSAAAFHAGMKVEEKTSIQDRFMASKVRIVVATIAFGMGIDKADIRNIIHYNTSGTIEEYSQQVGRAGRDGLPSYCMMYISHEDWYIKENFARGDLPCKSSLDGLLHDVFGRETVKGRDGEDVIKLNHNELSQTWDIRTSPLSILFATLELRYGLLRAITPEYSSYQFEDRGFYTKMASSDGSAEAKGIYKHAKRARKWYTFDIKAAMAMGSSRADLIRKLNQWNDAGAIMLKAGGVEHRYRVLKTLPRKPAEYTKLVNELYADMETREMDALKRAQDVVDLITGKRCFAAALAEHFGMSLPDGKMACGHCTFCTTKKPVELPPKPPVNVDIEGIKAVLKACEVRDDPRFLARVAFGIKSPRVMKLKLQNTKVFGSLEDHDFSSLIKEFTKACHTPES
ncbi:ATP-dependent DNA helicase Q-like 3 [Apiospora sp. TS-2023a]